MFEKGVELFLNKWKPTHRAFCDYFQKVWLRKNFSRFERYQVLIPSTNNALESFNNVIKRKYTTRRRLNIVKFNGQVFKLFKDMSSSYEENRTYAINSTIPTEAWTMAISWAKDKKLNHILGEMDEGIQLIFVPSSEFIKHHDRKISHVDVHNFMEFDSNDFDEFYDNAFFQFG